MDYFRLFLRQQKDNDKLPVHNEQTVNGLRKLAWASIFCLMYPCLPVSMFPRSRSSANRNGTDGKRPFPFVFCKTETASFHLLLQKEMENGPLYFLIGEL
jgi:hypothetical protein